MTKTIVISIIMILMMLASFLFYYSEEIVDPKVTLDSYNARLEDLANSQHRIEQALNEINNNLQLEASNVKTLNDKVVELSEKADIPPQVINTTRTIQEPPVVVKVPVPAPTTRAS